MIALLVLVLLSPKLRVNLTLSAQKDRYKEIYGKTRIDMEITFEEDEIQINNLTSGGKGAIKYFDLEKYHESQNFIYISTRANQSLIINKNKLEKGQKESLKEFLKTKNPNIF